MVVQKSNKYQTGTVAKVHSFMAESIRHFTPNIVYQRCTQVQENRMITFDTASFYKN